MKTHIAYRNFTMCKAAVLAALMGASVLLAPLHGSHQEPIADIEDHLDYGGLNTQNAVIRIKGVADSKAGSWCETLTGQEV